MIWSSEDFLAIRSPMLLSSLEHQRFHFLWIHALQNSLFTEFSVCEFWSSFFRLQTELFTPFWNCSVDTELIGRMNDSEQELCVRIIRIEMYGSFSFQLPQDSTTQGTGTCENWVTCFNEPLHHLWSNRIPYHVFSSSGPRNVQWTLRESLRIHIDFFYEFERQISSFPLRVQSMSLNIDMKIIRSPKSSGSIFLSYEESPRM